MGGRTRCPVCGEPMTPHCSDKTTARWLQLCRWWACEACGLVRHFVTGEVRASRERSRS